MQRYYGNHKLNSLIDDLGSDLIFKQQLCLSEHNIYGSSRLGVKQDTSQMHFSRFTASSIDTITGNIVKDSIIQETIAQADSTNTQRILGYINYELSNHLGNVLAVVIDKRIYLGDTTISGDTFALWDAHITTAQDYYPFGILMPNRHWVESDSAVYKYGFNGQERDDEWNGTGNAYDFGLRIYDARIARFLSVDPRTPEYPWQSPYVYHRNSPIFWIDFKGGGDPPKKDPMIVDENGMLPEITITPQTNEIENNRKMLIDLYEYSALIFQDFWEKGITTYTPFLDGDISVEDIASYTEHITTQTVYVLQDYLKKVYQDVANYDYSQFSVTEGFIGFAVQASSGVFSGGFGGEFATDLENLAVRFKSEFAQSIGNACPKFWDDDFWEDGKWKNIDFQLAFSVYAGVKIANQTTVVTGTETENVIYVSAQRAMGNRAFELSIEFNPISKEVSFAVAMHFDVIPNLDKKKFEYQIGTKQGFTGGQLFK